MTVEPIDLTELADTTRATIIRIEENEFAAIARQFGDGPVGGKIQAHIISVQK